MLWRQTSPRHTPSGMSLPNGHRTPRLGKFQPHLCVCESHDSIAQSCLRMKFSGRPTLEMRKISENLTGRFQDTEPPLGSVWHRCPSHHKPAFWLVPQWEPTRFQHAGKGFLLFLRYIGQDIPHEMHLATLPGGSGEGRPDRRNQPGVSI